MKLLFLTWFICFAPSILTQTIQLGSTLSPQGNGSWVSPSNAFVLGFYVAGGGGGMYRVGVSYATLSPTTVVWTAGRNVTVHSDALLELRQDGNLILCSSRGILFWESKTDSQGVVGAEMMDTGNFVLVNSGSQIVWQSFRSPSDTLVPGQQLGMGTNLTTVQPDSSISTYSLTLQENGSLSLDWNNDFSYWAYTGNLSSSSGNSSTLMLSLDSNGKLEFLIGSSASMTWLSSDYGPGISRRLTLDADGNLRIYSWATDSKSWIVGWQALDNQCDVYGWCGSYGFCSYNSTAPFCFCQQGFVAVDPQEATKGCTGSGDLSACAGGSQVVSLPNTALFAYGSDSYVVTDNDEGCKSACLKDPSCVAAIVSNDGAGECRQKRSQFITGYQFPFIQALSYLKVCNGSSNLGSAPAAFSCPSEDTPKSTRTSRTAVVIATFATLAGTVLLEVFVWGIFCRSRLSFKNPKSDYAITDFASGSPVKFTYRELQIATKNFSKKLGEGGYGAVYEGELLNGTHVAVKKLEGIQQRDTEFRTAVAIIGSTHHINLVHLVGFCSEGSQRLLVYEFVANLSLDKFLFTDSELSEPLLNWKARFSIAQGTARAIAYLHEQCRDCIIHCDIKPENILLDDHFSPKVSDFGLAKLLKEGRNQTETNVRGTRGYLAPEWLSDLPITTKSDVFSFGMVLLEIVSSRRNYDIHMNLERGKFPEWAFHQFQVGKLAIIADERLHLDTDYELEQLERVLQAAFWCIQDQASERPSMSKVIQVLEGNVSLCEPPLPKF